MWQTNNYKTPKQKRNYLNGLLTGKNKIYEIMDFHPFFFVEAEEPGMYYLGSENLTIPESDRRYTHEEIQRIRKMPNTLVTLCRFSGEGSGTPKMDDPQGIRDGWVEKPAMCMIKKFWHGF